MAICQFPPPLSDEQILDALTGEADAEVQAHLLGCPACRSRLGQEQRLDARLHEILFRHDCPSVEALRDYSFGLLAADVQALVAGHVGDCPRCQTELADLQAFLDLDDQAAAVAADSAKPKSDRPRPAASNVWRPLDLPGEPLFALRGGTSSEPIMLEFEGVTIFLQVEDTNGSLRLRGQVSTADSSRWTNALVAAQPAGEQETVTLVDESGAFQCRLNKTDSIRLQITAQDGVTLLVEAVKLQP